MSCVSPWRPAAVAALAFIVGACASPPSRRVEVPALGDVAARAREPEPAAPDVERRLGDHLAVEDVLTLVRARSPSLRAARARVRAVVASSKSTTRLPDATLKGEIWGAPLLQPWALDKANSLMLGVKQESPLTSLASSRRDLSSAAAAAESADLNTKEADAERDVRAAFVRYRLAFEERALHVEHVRITEATLEALHGAQASGHASAVDLTGAQVALTMAHADLAGIDGDEASARATLNAWMARPPSSALGAPEPDPSQASAVGSSTMTTTTSDAVLRAEADAAMRFAEAQAAVDDATLPTFMVGVDYWFMPTLPDPHAYGAMVSMSLPWLNPGRSGDVDAARERQDAALNDLEAVKLEIDRARAEAVARIDAEERQLAALEKGEISAAEQNVEATKNAFITGSSDARAVLAANALLLDARIRAARLRATVALARIDLARITNATSRSTP